MSVPKGVFIVYNVQFLPITVASRPIPPRRNGPEQPNKGILSTMYDIIFK
jgi:hypothetical protein